MLPAVSSPIIAPPPTQIISKDPSTAIDFVFGTSDMLRCLVEIQMRKGGVWKTRFSVTDSWGQLASLRNGVPFPKDYVRLCVISLMLEESWKNKKIRAASSFDEDADADPR